MCFLCVQLWLTLLWPHRNADHQDPLSMGFSQQEYWSGFPCPPPGNLSYLGIKPSSPLSLALSGIFFITGPPRKPDFPLTFIWKATYIVVIVHMSDLEKTAVITSVFHPGVAWWLSFTFPFFIRVGYLLFYFDSYRQTHIWWSPIYIIPSTELIVKIFNYKVRTFQALEY